MTDTNQYITSLSEQQINYLPQAVYLCPNYALQIALLR